MPAPSGSNQSTKAPSDSPDESNPLYVPLSKPPTAFSLTVRKVLGKMQSGEIRVPLFQRPLRWTAADVVKLFDSILKGYPVGSLLFWKQSFPETSSLLIGNAHISAPATADGWYLVDGQQRTTALAATLLDLDQGGDTRWALHFEPTRSLFSSKSPAAADKGRVVPLAVLGDIRRLGRWLRDCRLTDDEQSHVEAVQQRLLDYELPAYLLETDDIDALRGVFARLNSTGVRMRADEVFQALRGSQSKHARGSIDLRALQQACDFDRFGEPPRSEILKAVLAMSGVDPTRRLEDREETSLSNWVTEEDATEALQRTVAFLQASAEASEAPGAEIPAYVLLPYPVVFVILTRWFFLFPDPDPLTRRELTHWLWRGIAHATHLRSAVSSLRLQVRKISADQGMEASLRALLAAVGDPWHQEWSLDPFNATHAASRVEMLTLLATGPRDRSGLVSWRALGSSSDRFAREIIESASWKNLDSHAQALARTAANRILLDQRHTGLRRELQSWTWQDDHAAWETHFIDEAGAKALHAKDYSAFLRHRAARIRTEVSAFVSRRTGLGEPQLFPVESYYEDSSQESETAVPP